MAAEVIAKALGGRRNGKGWLARCPAHDDGTPSLSISDARGDRVLVHCHAGCPQEAVIDALRARRLWPTHSEGQSARRVVATYDYTDEAGALLYQVVRYEPKKFCQRRPNGPNDWIWSVGDTRKVLYHLPELIESVAHGYIVVIAEGEEDVEALRRLHLCATTNAGGAGKWRSEYNEHLRGADVVILPDNDDSGRDHAEAVATSLTDVAARIRVVELPDLPPKGDVSNWIAAGGTVERLHSLIDAARDWVPASDGNRCGKGAAPAGAEWWRAELINAQDLCAQNFPDIRYVVPGLFPEGVTLLASRPKLGKSWLLLQIGSAIATGTVTLASGEGPAPQGDVLYLALEDNPGRLKRRLTKYFGASRGNWPARLHLVTKWKRLDQGGLDAVREWCRSVKRPALVMIDTLKKIRPPKRHGQTDYDADYEACQGLQELASMFGITVIVAHHDRKMNAEDVFDTVSGTLGLTGGVDTVAILKRHGQGITLHIEGRDLVNTFEKSVSFDRETCRWAILGEAAEVQRSSERERVVSALKTAPDGLSISEIAARASLVSRGAADKVLGRMLEAGDVERLKRGVYGLPGTAAAIQREIREKGRSKLTGLKNQEDTVQSPNVPDLPEVSGTVRSDPPSSPTSMPWNAPEVVEMTHSPEGQVILAAAPQRDAWPDLPAFLDRRSGCRLNTSVLGPAGDSLDDQP